MTNKGSSLRGAPECEFRWRSCQSARCAFKATMTMTSSLELLAGGYSICKACILVLPQWYPDTVRCSACTQLVKYPTLNMLLVNPNTAGNALNVGSLSHAPLQSTNQSASQCPVSRRQFLSSESEAEQEYSSRQSKATPSNPSPDPPSPQPNLHFLA